LEMQLLLLEIAILFGDWDRNWRSLFCYKRYVAAVCHHTYNIEVVS